MKMNFNYFLIFVIGINYAATIRGKVNDIDSNENLIGATAVLINTKIGASTDVDGNFIIKNIPKGEYQIKISYIGYRDFLSEKIILENNSNYSFSFNLESVSLEASSIQVEAKLDVSNSSNIITNKKQSSVINDGVSSDDLSKTGDSNVADAVMRIPGVSISDGKFAVVRGLSSRYTNTVLNNSPIPSPESDKKIIPLDIIPTAVISSVSTYKTFTPDMEGTFAGGSVDIKTKSYPEKKLFKLNFSSGDKVSNSSSDFLIQNRSFLDFFGYKKPNIHYNNIPKNQVLHKASNYRPNGLSTIEWYGLLGDYGRELGNGYRSNRGKEIKPTSFGFNYGNKYQIKKNIEWGYFSNLSFSNNYTNRFTEVSKYSVADENYNVNSLMNNSNSSYDTNLGWNFSTGIKYLDNQIDYRFLYSHMSSDQSNHSRGYTPNIQPGLFIKESFEEKIINNHNISGIHQFTFFKSILDWSISNGQSSIYEPDIKSHNYEIINDSTNSSNAIYLIDRQAQKIGYRDFANGVDKNNNFDFNISSQFKLLNHDFKSKIGMRYQNKNREFERRSFSVTNSSSSNWNHEVLYTNSYSEIGQAFDEENYFSYNTETGEWNHGLILQDETANNAFNGYNAKEILEAYYGMIKSDLINSDSIKINLSIGARVESYNLNLNSYNPVTHAPSVTVFGDTTQVISKYRDILPALNLYINHGNNKKLHFSYSKTLNRPQFREMAPVAYQEFYQGDVAIGFPYLKPAYIKNYDIRFEWYITRDELFSIGYFSKYFTNPIESSFIQTPDLTYQTYQNAQSAKSDGIEIELRKSIPVIPINIGKISFSGNMTISNSNVTVDSIVTLFNGTVYSNAASENTRRLQGHSKYLLNLTFDAMLLSGYNFSLSYNTFSKRIHSIGAGALGDVYEFPYHLVNITANKKLSNNLKASFKIKNILNSKVRFGFEDNNQNRYYNKIYKPGYSYSIGLSYNI